MKDDRGRGPRKHGPRLRRYLDDSANERPAAVEGMVFFLVVTSGINALMLFLAPVSLDIKSTFGEYIIFVPYAGLVTMVVVMRGLWNRKRWSWVMAMLPNSAMLLYGVLLPITGDWMYAGIFLVMIFMIGIIWGLPVVFLLISRKWYFPPEPEE